MGWVKGETIVLNERESNDLEYNRSRRTKGVMGTFVRPLDGSVSITSAQVNAVHALDRCRYDVYIFCTIMYRR